MMKRLSFYAACVATVAALSGRAAAHDFWLLPAELVTAGDGEVSISLQVGEAFASEQEKPFDGARFTRVSHLHGGTTTDLVSKAVQGAKPMLRVALRGAGGHLIAVDRNPSRIELAPQRFEDYLRHEGLGAIVAERAKRGESGKPGRERYGRSMKTLVQVGRAGDPAKDKTYAAVLGQQLELVPEANPALAAPGSKLPVVLRFRGAPLAGTRIDAVSKTVEGVKQASYTTDKDGRVKIAIDRRGAWLVRTVHMVRCEGCPDADWESTWSSYTFGNTAQPATK